MSDSITRTVGVTGLAVMGANQARNLASRGHTVVVHNRHANRTDDLLREQGDDGDLRRAGSPAEHIQLLPRPRVVLAMAQADAAQRRAASSSTSGPR